MPLTLTSEVRVLNRKACGAEAGEAPQPKLSNKIDHISKTKNNTKKTHEHKNPIQNIAHLMR